MSLEARVAETLGSMGWPVLQGGLSTFLAVFRSLHSFHAFHPLHASPFSSSLVFVESFVVRMFFRTICLVVFLGLFHGLVLLPVILRSLTPRPALAARRRVLDGLAADLHLLPAHPHQANRLQSTASTKALLANPALPLAPVPSIASRHSAASSHVPPPDPVHRPGRQRGCTNPAFRL